MNQSFIFSHLIVVVHSTDNRAVEMLEKALILSNSNNFDIEVLFVYEPHIFEKFDFNRAKIKKELDLLVDSFSFKNRVVTEVFEEETFLSIQKHTKNTPNKHIIMIGNEKSVIKKILHKTHLPIYIVNSKQNFNYPKVLVPVDFSKTSHYGIFLAKYLYNHKNIMLVHDFRYELSQEYIYLQRMSNNIQEKSLPINKQEQLSSIIQLEQIARFHKLKSTMIYQKDTLQNDIVSYAVSSEYNVIVLASHPHHIHIFSSTIDKLLDLNSIDLVIITP